MHRPLTVIAAFVPALVLAGCGAGETAGAPSEDSAVSTSPGAISPEHGDQDIAFARMMVLHHEQAVAMSETLLAEDGVDQQVRDLAQRIAGVQGPEIAHMRSMLRAWGEEPVGGGHAGGADHGMGHGMDGMDGMMTDEDMDRLMAAEGRDAAVLFLEQMIEHHRGAVEMARLQIEHGTNPQAVELAQKVVEDQEAEIEEMESMLAEAGRS